MILFGILCLVFAAAVIGVTVYLKRRSVRVSQETPPNVDQDNSLRALVIVWVETYRMNYAIAPSISLVTGDWLNCSNKTGWVEGGECVAGMSWRTANRCHVAWPAGVTKFSDTAFAHELRHASAWHTGATSDHFDPSFQREVHLANEALRAAGL